MVGNQLNNNNRCFRKFYFSCDDGVCHLETWELARCEMEE